MKVHLFALLSVWLTLSTAQVRADSASSASSASSATSAREGWKTLSPRAEIRPEFRFEPATGPNGGGAFVIQHDNREGLDGFWSKEFPVLGGHSYRFQVYRRTENVGSPRRSAMVRLLWHDEKGRKVLHDEAPGRSGVAAALSPTGGVRYVTNVLEGMSPVAEAEYPLDKGNDVHGWTEVSDHYRAPAAATGVTVELHLQWAPGGKVAWSDPVMVEGPAQAARKVRLAAVHFRPTAGKTPDEKCRAFAPFIAEAAEQHADLEHFHKSYSVSGV